MNEIEKATTEYLMDSLRLDRLVSVTFNSDSRFDSITRKELTTGKLPDHVTKAIYKAHKGKEDPKVVIALKSIRENLSSEIEGVLNIPATAKKNGELSFDLEEDRPWIPRNNLAINDNDGLSLTVGNLSDFWRFDLKESEKAKSNTNQNNWRDYLRYAEKMFQHVENDFKRTAMESGYELIEQECYVRYFDNFDANTPIVDLYKKVRKSKIALPLYQRAISLTSPVEQGEINDNKIDEGILLGQNMLLACGTMNCEFPLADSQRRAIHAYLIAKNGDVLAVSVLQAQGKLLCSNPSLRTPSLSMPCTKNPPLLLSELQQIIRQ